VEEEVNPHTYPPHSAMDTEIEKMSHLQQTYILSRVHWRRFQVP
jgi:hypothetical protein